MIELMTSLRSLPQVEMSKLKRIYQCYRISPALLFNWQAEESIQSKVLPIAMVGMKRPNHFDTLEYK